MGEGERSLGAERGRLRPRERNMECRHMRSCGHCGWHRGQPLPTWRGKGRKAGVEEWGRCPRCGGLDAKGFGVAGNEGPITQCLGGTIERVSVRAEGRYVGELQQSDDGTARHWHGKIGLPVRPAQPFRS